jgi:hypothetical protein
MDGVCSTHGIVEKYIQNFGPKTFREETTRRRRWEDNIRIDLREAGCEGVDWINLAQDRDQWRAGLNTVMSLRIIS